DRKRLAGVADLIDVWVFVIGAGHTTNGVTEATLGEVWIDACTGHQGARRAPQIVQPPAGDARHVVELFLRARETLDGGGAVVGENILATAIARLCVQECLRSLAQRPGDVSLVLAAACGQRPYAVGDLVPAHAG